MSETYSLHEYDERPAVEFVTIENTGTPMGYAVMSVADEGEVIDTVFHPRFIDAKREAKSMAEVYQVGVRT